MRKSSASQTVCAGSSFIRVLALAGLCACAQIAGAQSAPAAGVPKMEDVYKNIQVFKGMPADQMLITMRFIRASLGVSCVYCHAEPEGQTVQDQKPPSRVMPGWWADEPFREVDTPRKQMARMMIRMTAAINKENFGGGNQITCFTCHRGSAHPASNYDANLVSPMSAPESKSASAADAKAISGVSADELMDKFVAAVGGTELQNIKSRVEKGMVQYGSMISGRAAGRNQPPYEFEISAKAPDMRAAVTHEGNGVVRSFSGDKGWQQGRISTDPRHQPRDMRNNELDVLKLEDPYFFAGRLKQFVTGLRVARLDKVDGKEAYVVAGRTQGLAEVQLYFDRESGMLVREVALTQGLVGRLPTQFDFADFRTVDGVKVPFRFVSTEIAEGLTFTYQIDQVQQNVPVDEAKFVRPAAYMALFASKPR
jgi:photosynthetic reaction center cytochrome c subunit